MKKEATLTRSPKWWTNDMDSAWERTKAAFRRDWEQTKHDFGKDDAKDLDQDVDNTVKQAAGKEAIPPLNQRNFDDLEPGFRFGHGARSYYRSKFPTWNKELESKLRDDWGDDWPSYRHAIRYGYERP